MSYSICNIIVGSPIPQAVLDAYNEYDFDLSDAGFTELYTAGGPPKGYCGVKIHQFDRGDDLRIAELLPNLAAQPFQFTEAQTKLVEARNKLGEILDAYMEGAELETILASIPVRPEVWLVWNDS